MTQRESEIREPVIHETLQLPPGYRLADADDRRHRRAVAAASKTGPTGRVTLAGYLAADEVVSGGTGGVELRSGFALPAGYTLRPRDEARHLLATMLAADGGTYLAAASEIDDAMDFTEAVKALEERIVAKLHEAARAEARVHMLRARQKAEAGDYAGAIEAMEAAWDMTFVSRSNYRDLSKRLRTAELKGLGKAASARAAG